MQDDEVIGLIEYYSKAVISSSFIYFSLAIKTGSMQGQNISKLNKLTGKLIATKLLLLSHISTSVVCSKLDCEKFSINQC